MFTKENLKQLLDLQLEAEKAALVLYKTYLSLVKELGYDTTWFAEPEEMSFHSINDYGTTLSCNHNSEFQKEFSWQDITNPNDYCTRLKTYLETKRKHPL